MNRRNFLRTTAGAAAGFFAFRGRVFAFQQSPAIEKFTQALPGLGPTGIPVAVPVSAASSGADVYHFEARQFTQQILPAGYGKTTLWGYVDANGAGYPNNQRYLGPLIVARKGRAVRMQMTNKLPNKHILPVDTSLMGAEADQFVNRICVHLHGGFTPWTSDGGPFTWFAPGPWDTSKAPLSQYRGECFLNGTGVDGQAEYYYPNNQSARLSWYHDHAMGITRLNAYAGLAAGYLIGDDFEDFLIKIGLVPATQIPLIIQDKSFNEDGSLWYPTAYEGPSAEAVPDLPNPWVPLTQQTVNSFAGQKGRWDRDTDKPVPMTPSCVPEFFSDTILVNGAPWPNASIAPAPTRFRLLNGSQARFYNLQLYYESKTMPGEADLTRPGPAMIQIGTEGGFLWAPAVLNNPPKQIGWDTNTASPTFGNANSYNLLLGPAERADVIIDFSHAAGSSFILYNDAPAPFPMGDQRNDYYTGDVDATLIGGSLATLKGYGPNTRTLMRIEVTATTPTYGKPLPALVGELRVALAEMAAAQISVPNGCRVRDLTLNEDFDEFGRLIQKLGTNVKPDGSPDFGRGYMDPTTENPRAGDTEIWRVFNLTGDTHPMHFHLVNVQVLGRQPFDAENFAGRPRFTGAFRGPDPNEVGLKETVRMNPNEMTVLSMKFDLPKVPFKVPRSPRTGGYEYVWHCHILEHEEHDMMRPLVVMP